ncbi:MAG: hypothetical protein IPN58_07980 [Anaerolineales bacterium]|nr:hypothetical protein [Anaerolineales bacterium]
MNNNSKNDPGARLRKLLGNTSPLTRLPKKTDASASSFLPEQEDKQAAVPANKDAAHQTPLKPAPVSKKRLDPDASLQRKFNFFPAFWTIASIFSMIVNLVLLIVLGVLLLNIKTLQVSGVMDLGTNLLGGLYTNFEKMDRAHIITNIPVETTIPVKFDLQLNQNTNVILSQDVTITNALVTVNTGGLNITRALTTIVLPQGTNLPVVLNLTVPVDTTVPVVLNVPVDIPLEKTELHDPFLGLRNLVQPYYCMLKPDALTLDNQPACQ